MLKQVASKGNLEPEEFGDIRCESVEVAGKPTEARVTPTRYYSSPLLCVG
jgi:hypothetical protein